MSRPPVTGRPGLDEACAEVSDLSGVPLADHVRRYTDAHEAIVAVLNAPIVVDDVPTAGVPVPGTASTSPGAASIPPGAAPAPPGATPTPGR